MAGRTVLRRLAWFPFVIACTVPSGSSAAPQVEGRSGAPLAPDAPAAPSVLGTPEALTAGLPSAEYYTMLARARRLSDAREHAAAVPLLKDLAEAYLLNGEVWARLGRSLFALGSYRDAVTALQRGLALGVGFEGTTYTGLTEISGYLIAVSFVRLDMPDSALAWLERAVVDQPYRERYDLASDPAFEALRDRPRFRRIAGLPADVPSERTAGWRMDLERLRTELSRLDYEYRKHAIPNSILHELEAIERAIHTSSDMQIVVSIMQLLSRIGHGHSWVELWTQSRLVDFRAAPLKFYRFPEGLFVVEADTAYHSLVGSRVLTFDSTPADAALRAMGSLLVDDNEMDVLWRGPGLLLSAEILHALGMIDTPDRLPLRLVSARGDTVAVSVETRPERRLGTGGFLKLRAPVTVTTPPLWLSRPDENFWFAPLAQNVLYLQLNQIAATPNESLDAFGLRLREYLREHPQLEHLVLDLRRNNGGNSFTYVELLRTLVGFDTRPATHLFVLAGRNTYSAAQNLATELDRLTDAIFVGEPTGSRPNAYGDPGTVVLPYSGLRLGLATGYWQFTTSRDTRPWVAPDMPVALTAADYFSGADPVLDAVLEYVRRDR